MLTALVGHARMPDGDVRYSVHIFEVHGNEHKLRYAAGGLRTVSEAFLEGDIQKARFEDEEEKQA